MKNTWTITEENVTKIIARFEKAGRKVDNHIANIIFRNSYQNKAIEAQYSGDVCDMFASDLWNAGAIK
jgi:hypothetical protein